MSTRFKAGKTSDGTRKVRVGVVFGGKSENHGVSCLSAGAALGALGRDKYEVYAIGITKDGQWIKTSGNPNSWRITGRTRKKLPEVKVPLPSKVPLFGKLLAARQNLSITIKSGGLDLDVVLPLLTDGGVVGTLETVTNSLALSGASGVSNTSDKHFMKLITSASGVNVPKWLTVRVPLKTAGKSKKIDSNFKFTQSQTAHILELSNNWKSPLFVKPSRGGSSIGVSKVNNEGELIKSLLKAAKIDQKVIIEEFIKGREIECAVLETPNGLHASTLGEVKAEGFYDFEQKFITNTAKRTTNPVMDKANKERIQNTAKLLFEVFELRGYARFSVLLTSSGQVYLNSISTSPDLSGSTLFTSLLEKDGYLLSEALDILIGDAINGE